MGGGKGTINALNDHNGPSWRMVVEMGDTIKAYGIYPGGQSGNPGSPWYDNMIGTWQQGRLNELVFLLSRSEEHTSELQSLMRISYAVFCLKKQTNKTQIIKTII